MSERAEVTDGRTDSLIKQMGNIENRNELLMQIRELGFALYDLILFLDTHPQDSGAGSLFEEYLQKYKEIRKEFAGLYGPLTVFDEKNGGGTDLSWGQAPMPWEGGC